MRMHRFYTTEKLEKDIIHTNGEHLHQWKNVFRYQAGDRVVLFGDGQEHEYKIIEITKKEAKLHQVNTRKSRLQQKNITLALALIKKENFELALSKCTEIGVTTFIPVISNRSLQKMYGRERLEKIVIEATEQSGWGTVPAIKDAISFTELLKEKVIVFDMSGEDLKEIDTKESILCIGPEGGWSDEEILLAKDAALVAKLNTGVLRAETGAIVVSGILKNT